MAIAVGAAVALLGGWAVAGYAMPMSRIMAASGRAGPMMGTDVPGMGMQGSGGMGSMMRGMGMHNAATDSMMNGYHPQNMTATQMQRHQEYCAQMIQQSKGTGMMGSNTVAIANYQFLPATLTVKTGTTVTWVNMDQVAHTVSAGTHEQETGLFESGLLNHMDRFSFTFTELGTYTYHCDPHPYMTGTLVVEA